MRSNVIAGERAWAITESVEQQVVNRPFPVGLGCPGHLLRKRADAVVDPLFGLRQEEPRTQLSISLDRARLAWHSGNLACRADAADRFGNGCLHFWMADFADVTHALRKIVRGDEKAVDVVDCENFVEIVHRFYVLDQNDHQSVVIGNLRIVSDAKTLS